MPESRLGLVRHVRWNGAINGSVDSGVLRSNRVSPRDDRSAPRGCENQIPKFGIRLLRPWIGSIDHQVSKVTWVVVDHAVDLFVVNFDIVDILVLHKRLSDRQLRPSVHWQLIIAVVGVAHFVVNVTRDVENVFARVEAHQRHAIARLAIVVATCGEMQQVHP